MTVRRINLALRVAIVFIGLFVALANPSRSAAEDTLRGDQNGQLGPGQFLVSKSGRYSLVFEGSGCIVLYDNWRILSGVGYWYNGAVGRVVYGYTPYSTPVLWSTNTRSTVYDNFQFAGFSGGNVDAFVMQGDGNLVVYGSIFTFGHLESSHVPFWNVGISNPAFATTGGHPILELQDDGNLVIYVYNRHAIWSYRTGHI